MQQREGRLIRQGNENPKVEIYTYVTENTCDIQREEASSQPNKDGFCLMEIEETVYAEKKTAGSAILEAYHAIKRPEPFPLGKYRGLAMELYFDPLPREY